MFPISNFDDHPRFKNKYDYPRETIYLLDSKLYLATIVELKQITITKLQYTNAGEPYRQFARAEYTSSNGSNYIEISASDAAFLYFKLKITKNLDVKLGSQLAKLREFESALDDLIESD